MNPVTENENAFKKWKEETRREALENEVDRLKTQTTEQASMIKKMRYALVGLTVLFLVALIGVFSLLSSSSKAPNTIEPSVQKKENPTVPNQEKELIVISPVSDTIKFKVPENGIIYSIQIGAYLGRDLQKFNNNMLTLQQHSGENINQFTLGLFTSYTEALEFREIVNEMGFKDAYVTALKNGKRIQINEAIQAENQQH